MNTLKMESSDTSTNSLLHQVKQEPNSMDMDKSEDILLGTIKLEIFETKPACPPNSNQQISDVLSSVKTETKYSDHDHFINFNTVGGTKRWTVTSSAVIPLVKREHSIDPDYEVFESTHPEGAMQAPTLGTDLLSSSGNGNENHSHFASKPTLSSDVNKEYPLHSPSLKFAVTKEQRDGDGSSSSNNQDASLPQGGTNTSNHGWFTSKGHMSQYQPVSVVCTAEKPYKCKVCDKEFTESYNLNQHLRIHSGDKPYKCSVCSKEFTQSGSLTQHQHTHTGEKLYKCSICSNKFPASGNLTKHMRVHTGEKPFKCSICSKDFSDSSTLTKHIRVHTGEKPYKCSVCCREFPHSCDLTRHQRTHTGEKPHKCSLCCKAFTGLSSLKRHKRIHTGEKPYKCSVCAKDFSDSSTLTQHLRIHTGEKRHKCSVCGMAFTQSSGLSTHQRIHTGEKPYKCSVCGQGFSQSSSLSKHQRTKHRGEKTCT